MSKFRSSKVGPIASGATLTIMTSKEDDYSASQIDSAFDHLSKSCDMAIQMLEKSLEVLGLLATSTTYYPLWLVNQTLFCIPAESDMNHHAATFAEIKRVLSVSCVGLKTDLALKIHAIPDVERDGKLVARGGLVLHKPPKFDDAVPPNLKPLNPRQNLGVKDGVPVVNGAIHLHEKYLSRSVGLTSVLIVHEATHKFAQTVDYCYFQNCGRWDVRERQGYSCTDPARALKNADSYAFFARKVWEFHDEEIV